MSGPRRRWTFGFNGWSHNSTRRRTRGAQTADGIERLEGRLLLAAGALDTTFGSGGKVITSFVGQEDEADRVIVQPDGRILVSGATRTGATTQSVVLARYTMDGALDASFGSGGKVTTVIGPGDDGLAPMALQSDGKVVVAGSLTVANYLNFAVARYNSDGTLDTTFGTAGKTTFAFGFGDETPQGITLQSDGKIVVAGLALTGTGNQYAVARLNSNGSLDPTFDGDGKVLTSFGSGGHDEAQDVRIQPDGKIVVLGDARLTAVGNADFGVVRYNTDGSLDPTFGSGGKVTTGTGPDSNGDFPEEVVLQPDGKIVAGGTTSIQLAQGSRSILMLVRYNANGALDGTFGSGGIVTFDPGVQLSAGGGALQPNGRIVVGGTAVINGVQTMALARFNSNGTLDTSFDGDGTALISFDGRASGAAGVAIQADGKIVAVGGVEYVPGAEAFALARVEGDGPAPAGPFVTLSLAGSPFSENGGTATITATLSVTTSQPVSIALGFTGTATNGADYIRSADAITIPVGSTTGSITLTGVVDNIADPNEHVIVDIIAVSNASESGTQQVDATIAEPPPGPTVTLGLTGSPLAENGGMATVTATLSAATNVPVTVKLLYSGTATLDTDYTRSAESIVVAAGNTSGTLKLTGVADAVNDPNETIVIDISFVSNGTESGNQQVTAVITDVAPLPIPKPGDFYAADSEAFGGNGAVFFVDNMTGVQTVVSAGGNFRDPTGVALAANGDLYVADSAAFGGSGGVIRVNPFTGVQTVVSSGGNFVTPIGIAIEADGNLVVTDQNDDFGDGSHGGKVIRVNPATGAQTLLSFAGSLVSPAGIVVAPDGSLIVGDVNAFGSFPYNVNHGGAVLRVDPVTGAQTTISSGGDFFDPQGVALDSNGKIIVADHNSFAGGSDGGGGGRGGIFRVEPANGQQTQISVGGSFVAPAWVAVQPDGMLLVSDLTADTIFRVNPATGSQTALSSGQSWATPQALTLVSAPTVALSLSGSPLAENGGRATVTATLSRPIGLPVTISLAFTGTATNGTDYTPSSTSLTIPAGSMRASLTLTATADTITDSDETIIVDITGVTNGVEAGTQQVTATIVEPPSGEIYVAVAGWFDGSGGVIRINLSTGAQTTVSSGGFLHEPQGLAVAPNGDIYVVDSGVPFDGPGGIIRVNPVTGAQTAVSQGGLFVTPTGIAIEADGNLVVADREGRGMVIRVNPVTGAQSLLASHGLLRSPAGITIADDGFLIVGDLNAPEQPPYNSLPGGALLRINPQTGEQSTISAGGDFFDPQGVAIDADGQFLVADHNSFVGGADGAGGGKGAIFRIDPNTGAKTIVSSGGQFSAPAWLIVDPSGSLLVSDFGREAIFRVDPATGAQMVVSSGGTLLNPQAMAFVPRTLPRIVVSPTTGLVTTESGTMATFTVQLTTQPTANVTVTLISNNVSEGTVSPGTLVFTPANYNTPQTVTVTGVDDGFFDLDRAYTIVTAPAFSADPQYNGLDAADVSVTNTDNETARMYRAFNPFKFFHFFTTSRGQFENAVAAGYTDETEGRAGFSILPAQDVGSTRVYRLYNFQTGHHYYTLDATERAVLVNIVPPTSPQYGTVGWRDEGSEGFMYGGAETGTTTIYRLYNNQSGTHLFTENAGTRATILAQFPGIWVEHNPLGFALPIFLSSSATQPAATAAATARQTPTVTRTAADPQSERSDSGTPRAAPPLDGLLAPPATRSRDTAGDSAQARASGEDRPRRIATRSIPAEPAEANDAVFASALTDIPWENVA